MKKSINKRNHGKTIIMHLKRHHRKYFCGIFGGFALIKMALLFFGISPVLNIGNIFADSEEPITLDTEYLTTNCTHNAGDIFCTGKNIGSIEPGIFSGLNIGTLDLSYNKLSNLDFEVFKGSAIDILDINHNQIYKISNPEIISGTEVKISYNCLPINMITEIQNTDGNKNQLVCFYVEYQPATRTNWIVTAKLSLTGDDSKVSSLMNSFASAEAPHINFDRNRSDVLHIGQSFKDILSGNENSGDIINYNVVELPADVNWIEDIAPNCLSGNWNYSPTPNNGWNKNVIEATITGVTDRESGILTGRGTCIIEEGAGSHCTVVIDDIAGNKAECLTRNFNVDTHAPTITLTDNTSTTIDVEINDNTSGLPANGSVWYKRQATSGCTAGSYSSKALDNTQGASHARTTILKPNDDNNHYLCISGVSDIAGNISEIFSDEVSSNGTSPSDSTKPSCIRQTPTKTELTIGENGSITLKCTDAQGIATKSLSSWNINYNQNIISLSNTASTGVIENGIKYTFSYTALSAGTISLLLKTGVIEDNAGNYNNSANSQNITVSNGHTSATEFVEFPIELLDGWARSDSLGIVWKNGATGGYDYFDDNNVSTKNWANIPYIIPSNFSSILMLSFNNYLHNNKYVCAFGQIPGEEPQTICSEYKIQIDYEDPEITITSPANNSNLVLGSDAILQWSGNDYGYSGISGYILSINKPSGPLNSIALGANTSQWTITLDETGTWLRSITINDHALNSGMANGSFHVVTSNEPPVINGDLGNLVEFPVQLLNGWARSDSLRIEWLNGATGGYDYFDDNDVSTKDWANIPYIIPSSFHNVLKLSFNNYLSNNKYICAFGQLPGYEPQTICSDHKIQIDYEDPEITIVSPSNYDNFLLGSGITLKWSGADYGPSDISGYILKITKPSGPLNPIVLPANTTQRNVTLNETGTWRRSVTIKDHAQNSGIANGTFYVIASNEPPVINGNLIEFAIEVSPTWVQQDVVRLELYQGADGGYAYFNTNDIGVIDWSGGYDPIPTSGFINLSSSNNGEYICAFGSKWGATQSVCSEHPIKIDNTNPHILLEYPSDGSDFKKGADIRLNWSGWDIQSGISGYTLKITDPSGENISYDFGANTIEKIITLDDAGTRYRSVVAYDKTDHSTTSYTGFFYVSDDGIIPENGFYLISPALGDKIRLGEDVILSWHHGATNNGYEWEVKNISGTRVSYGTTGLSTVAIDDSYFTTGGYSWSVKDIASDTTKTIPLFYIVDGLNIPDLMVRQFEFNEIEDADLDEYYQSDVITVKGLEDGWYTLAYLGSGKGALYINDEFVGVTGFVQNGDKVYVEMKASDEYNTTVKTTLYIGVGDDVVSGDYKITTKDGIHSRDDPSLTPMQKLWGIIYIDSLIEMYQYDHEKLAIFLSTFMQLLQDKSDYYAKLIQEAEEDGDEELVKEYKLYKEAIDFLYITVKYRYDNLEVEDRTVYIAPNGKQYLVEFDESRMAYTSPDFARPKYFPTWELFKNHIDLNNPAVGKWGIVGNVITTHNGKVYTIYETNGKWTSSNFKTAKYFDTKEDIINHILANNPASNWNHTIDTNFDEVKYTAPNGKVYKIFRTSSKGNNPEMYSSYDFVNAKYFTSLEAAKKFIDQNNPKK